MQGLSIGFAHELTAVQGLSIGFAHELTAAQGLSIGFGADFLGLGLIASRAGRRLAVFGAGSTAACRTAQRGKPRGQVWFVAAEVAASGGDFVVGLL